jgi:hypothetical protein
MAGIEQMNMGSSVSITKNDDMNAFFYLHNKRNIKRTSR